jgi:general secretion pathway protein J
MKIKNGYTLLEVLVALTVFAILATITASAMYNAFNTRARVSVQANQLNELQVAIAIIERDTQQIIERNVFANDMQQSPPFVGESNYLEFTRGGSVNPIAVERRSTLKRVAYICAGKKLIRRGWDNLDIPNRKNHEDKVLLDHLETCSFAYLSNSRQVLPDWRPYAVQQTQKEETIPIAIQLKATVADWGNMSLLFIVPGARYAPS